MKAFVLGGEEKFIRNQLSPKLLDFGIDVVSIWNWDNRKPVAYIPAECDTVIVIKDMTGHTQRNVVRTLAKKQGLRFIEVPRKWSIIQKHLTALGLTSDSNPPLTQSIDGEDFQATFSKVVEAAYEAFKENPKKRPTAEKIAKSLKIPSWHLALQKGIATGVAKANGEDVDVTKVEDGWSLFEMVGMCLNDYPEMIRDLSNLCHFVADLVESKNDAAFQKEVKGYVSRIKKAWVRCSRKAETHPDRIYIDGLKTKWFEEYARNRHANDGEFPQYSESNVYARSVFDSQLTRSLYRAVVDSLNEEMNPDPVVEDTVEVAETEPVAVGDNHAICVEPIVMEEPKPKKKAKTKKPRRLKSKALREQIARFFHLLGKCQDSQIAELAGCSTDSVRLYRVELGIDKFSKGQPQSKAEDLNLLPLELVEFDTKSQPVDYKRLETKIAELESKVAELESRRGTVGKPPRTSMGEKVDELIAAGFKVKLEVTQ